MIIKLSPIASNKTTSVSISGLILTVDGIDIDLSVIPENGQADAEDDSPLIGVVTRDEVTIFYEYNSQLAEPYQSTNWDDYTFEVTDGEVPCPIKWKPVMQEVLEDV